MQHRSVTRLLALALLLALWGCNKAANNSATSSDNSSAPAQAPAAAPAPPPERPKPIVVPAGTVLVVTIDQTISSKTNNAGDSFDASLAQPVAVDGHEVIPSGSKAAGTVVDAKSAGRFKGGAALSIDLSAITVHGKTYNIETAGVSEAGKGRGKRTAVGAGGGAALGAIVGAIAGGGKGAAIGALAGGGAGTGAAAMTGNRDITLPAETQLTFKLTQPLTIERR